VTETIFAADAKLNSHEPIQIEQWNSNQQRLGSLREEKSYEYSQHDDDEPEHKGHRKEDTMFRLNTKRMSYKGFEFGDFGFMTTDFDQLSRGHTQWVNQVMHHPVQNGIVITASDDWCVMFWRFKKAIGNEELKQEKINSMLNKQKIQNKIEPNASNNYYIDPKLQHIVGEIDLLPVLKINTGLEVKAIAMSADASVLACTCYDEEEDEGNPELQLYFDMEQNWTFKHHQFHPYLGNVSSQRRTDPSPLKQQREHSTLQTHEQDDREYLNTEQVLNNVYNASSAASSSPPKPPPNETGRLISRRIISLPFEPIPHCLCFTRDNKYVFVAMYSSQQILIELNEELEEEYGADSVPAEARKWPDHPISLCCINVHTSKVLECDKISKYLGDDEHVSCMSISPNGARIAMGTSLGQLIVTGVLNLTNDFEDEDDFNPLLQKIWSSHSVQLPASEPATDIEDTDGSITAIDWSADSDWIICGHASGVIKLWKKNTERRISTQLNRTIRAWMGAAKVERKNSMFSCKYYLEGLHVEAINSISIRGSLMVSGADDGNVVVHDLLETFIDSPDNKDNSPITIAKVDKIHGGRMVNSVCLTRNYSEDNLLIPSTGFFMVTSGADNIVHCVSLLDVVRESARNINLADRASKRGANQK